MAEQQKRQMMEMSRSFDPASFQREKEASYGKMKAMDPKLAHTQEMNEIIMQDAKKTTRLSADEARSPVGTAAEARPALEERDASSCGAPGAGAALSSRCCDGSAAPRKMPSARNRGPLLKHV